MGPHDKDCKGTMGGLGCRGLPKVGVPFLEGPHNKDENILGSILGSPHFASPPRSGFSLCAEATLREPRRSAAQPFRSVRPTS